MILKRRLSLRGICRRAVQAILAQWGIYLQAKCFSISQSAALTALFTKESLAIWIVYIEFRLQINTPKNHRHSRPLVKGGGFRKKTGGIDLDTIN